jgi:hypothetical protein
VGIVQRLAVHGGFALRPRIERSLRHSPVILVGPVGAKFLQRGEFGTVFPFRSGHLIGPTGVAQAGLEIGNRRIGHGNAERFVGGYRENGIRHPLNVEAGAGTTNSWKKFVFIGPENVKAWGDEVLRLFGSCCLRFASV